MIRFFLLFSFSVSVPLLAGSASPSPVEWNADTTAVNHGYDPVSYFQAAGPRKGATEHRFVFEGGTFLFVSAENLAAFKTDPEKYLPAYRGWCAYAMADGDKVDVDPKTFKILGGRVHLFYNGWLGNTLTKWNKTEATLKPKADEAWQKLNATRGDIK